MKGKSICEICGKEFEWIRAKSQVIPRACGKQCCNKLPRDWVTERFKRQMGDENQQKEKARERFEGLVIKKEGCWDWKGCEHHSGYLPFRYIGRKNDFAHRSSWRIYKGEIQNGMLVLHKCDNKRCTNPEHLFLGSHKENTEDMHKKGRGCCGEKNKRSILREEQIKDIKKLLKMGVSMARIARDYGVTNGTIWFIAHKVTWKHIEV